MKVRTFNTMLRWGRVALFIISVFLIRTSLFQKVDDTVNYTHEDYEVARELFERKAKKYEADPESVLEEFRKSFAQNGIREERVHQLLNKAKTALQTKGADREYVIDLLARSLHKTTGSEKKLDQTDLSWWKWQEANQGLMWILAALCVFFSVNGHKFERKPKPLSRPPPPPPVQPPVEESDLFIGPLPQPPPPPEPVIKKISPEGLLVEAQVYSIIQQAKNLDIEIGTSPAIRTAAEMMLARSSPDTTQAWLGKVRNETLYLEHSYQRDTGLHAVIKEALSQGDLERSLQLITAHNQLTALQKKAVELGIEQEVRREITEQHFEAAAKLVEKAERTAIRNATVEKSRKQLEKAILDISEEDLEKQLERLEILRLTSEKSDREFRKALYEFEHSLEQAKKNISKAI